jgi:hypothetical protein
VVLGALALAAATGLTACGDKITNNPTPVDSTIHSVTVTPPSLTLKIGDVSPLSASVQAGPGAKDKTVKWASGNAAVATVDANGVVTAKGGGNTTVTATSNADPSVSGAAAISVGQTAPATVTIATINQGVGCQPGAGVTPGLPANLLNACGQLDVTLNVDPGSGTLAGVDLIMNCTGNGNSGVDTVVATQGSAASNVTPMVSDATAPITLSVNTAAFNATTGVVSFRNAPCTLKARARLVGSAQTANTSTSLTLNNVDVKILTNSFAAGTGADGTAQLTSANDANGLPWHAGSVTVAVVPVLYSGRTVASVSVTLPNLANVPTNTGGTLTATAAPFSVTFVNSTSNSVTARVGQITLIGGVDANGFPTPITPQVVVVDAAGNDLSLVDPPPPFVQASFRLDNTSPQPPVSFVIPARQQGWINAAFTFTGSGNNNAPTADSYISCGDGYPVASGGGYACNPNGPTNIAPPAIAWAVPGAGVGQQVGVSAGGVSGNSGTNGNTTFTYYSIAKASYPGLNTNGTSTSSTSCSITGWTKIATGNDLAETITNQAYVVRVFEADKLNNSRCTDVSAARLTVNTGGWANGAFGVDKTPPVSAFVDSSASNPGGTIANMTIKIGEPVPTYNVSFQENVVGSGFSATPVSTKLTRLAIDPGTGAASTTGNTFGCPITFSNNSCGTSALGGTLPVDATSAANPVSSGIDGYYTYTATVLDLARNAATALTRTIVIDRQAPVMGGVGVPATIVGGATASFATSATDNLDLVSTDFSLTYGNNPAGNPALAFLIRANGPSIGTAFDNVLTTTASFSLNVTGFIRNLQTAAAGGAPTNNSATGLPSSITVRAYDAVGNPGASAPAPIAAANVPQANLTIYANPQAGSGQTFLTWLVTNAATMISNCPASGCGGAGTPLNPTSFTITAAAVGTENVNTQFTPPFTAVQFYYYNPAFGEWVFIGSSSTPVGTDNAGQTQRTFTYSLGGFDPPASLPTGALNLLAIGVNASGDALATPVNANITLTNP